MIIIQRLQMHLYTPIFAFDFLYGVTMALDKRWIPVNRGDLFINEILSTLNGVQLVEQEN